MILLTVSLASLATGKKATFIQRWGTSAVAVSSYPFLKILKGIEHGFGYVTGLVFSYNAARQEADSLRQQLVEATQYNAQRKELLQENRRLRQMMGFVRNEPGLTLEPVEVLETFKGILVIDRGAMDGIKESMCAVTEQGIVGVITQVDAMTANVVTLHHSDCKVGGMFERNRVRGIIHGSNSEVSRYCTIHYIDMKDDVRVGDRVVTSPESIFPTGYPIGRVVRVEENTGSVWKIAYLEPAVDFYQLDEVFILRQAMMPANELMGQSDEEEPQMSVAPATPDPRSLQERYAP